MKLYIFGTGSYYRRISKYINGDEIIALVDNDVRKRNTFIDGRQVILPEDAAFELCDYVVILVYEYEAIFRQLAEVGVPEHKILCREDMAEKLKLNIEVELDGKRFSADKLSRNGKSIFLCVHEFSRTGVPVAVMNTAKLLRKMGFDVIMGALSEGNLVQELQCHNLPYIHDLNIFSEEKWCSLAERFDLVILGTICVSKFGNAIAYGKVPIIWWLHESRKVAFERHKLPVESKNVQYYGGGSRVVKLFSEYYPQTGIEKLLYFLPGITHIERKKNEGKLFFALIASFELRKAQDIFLAAIEQMREEDREEAGFVMVGDIKKSVYDIDWLQKEVELPQLSLLGELSQSELEKIFEEIDVLVCPSRDDPMPIVVTQAMQYGIPCIVSTEVGQAEYITHRKDGVIVEADNVKALTDAVKYCIDHKDQLPHIGKLSKRIFDENFSEQEMCKNLAKIVRHRIGESL